MGFQVRGTQLHCSVKFWCKLCKDPLHDEAFLSYTPCLCNHSCLLLILNHTSAPLLPAHHFWRPHLPGTALAFRVFHLLQLQEATGREALHSCGGSVLLCWVLQGVCCQEVCWMQESYYRYVGLNAAPGQWVLKVRTVIPQRQGAQGWVTSEAGLVTQAQSQHFTCDLTLEPRACAGWRLSW